MKRKITRFVSTVLCISCLIGLCAIPSYAADEATVSLDDRTYLSEYTFENIPQKLLSQIQQTGGNEASSNAQTYSVSGQLQAETASEAAAVNGAPVPVGLSLDSADDLTSLTVINSDGSKTLYRYFEDVKFVDQSGKIRFKDNGIYQSHTRRTLFDSYAFENGTNNTKTFFPEKISKGLKLEAEDITISLKPFDETNRFIDEKSAAIVQTADREACVQYDDVFGPGTALQYIPVGAGVKEYLMLDAHPGRYEFSFELDTHGLQPAAMEGESVSLLDPITGEEAARLEAIDMQDSCQIDGTFSPHVSFNNSFRLETTRNQNRYILTMLLDHAFLDSPETVYPVTVDPTVIVSVYNAQSVTVYANGMSTSNVNVIGTTTFGNAYTYIKTNSMQGYSYINTNNITRALYRAYEHSGNVVLMDTPLEVYATWFTTPANQVTYAMCDDVVHSYNPSGRCAVPAYSSNRWIDFPIKSLVIDWIDAVTTDYSWSEDYGFVLRNALSAKQAHRLLYPPGSEINPPYILISYTEDISLQSGLYYIQNALSGRYLDVENASNHVDDMMINVIAWPFHGALNQIWRVESLGNGSYTLHSMYPFSEPKYLDNTSGNAYVANDSGGDSERFRIVQNLDGTYRVFNNINPNMALDLNYNPANTENYQKNVAFFAYHGGENQNWIFEPVSLTANVNNYYDNGLLKRWSMTATQMQGSGGIPHWQNLARTFFSELFDLELTFSAVQAHSSTADQCGYSTIEALDQQCSHTDKHKDIATVKQQFLTAHSDSIKTVNIFWTGHFTYEDGNAITNVGVHTGKSRETMVANNYNLHQGSHIVMQNSGNNGGTPSISFTSDEMRARRTYLHELCHAFGAVDSYCKKDGSGDNGEQCSRDTCAQCYGTENGYSTECIMSKKEPNTMGSSTPDNMQTWLCDKCKEDISDYVLRYFHQVH